MKRILVYAVLAFFPGVAGNVLGQQRTFNVSPGQKLTIDLKTGGSIRIVGWDKPVVSADVSIEGRDAASVRVDYQQTARGVEISSRYDGTSRNHSSDARFGIQVPSTFDIEVHTMGGGIGIDGVSGRFTGNTMGGELDLHNLKGYVELKTMGGKITLMDSEVDGNLHTMGGEVLFQNVAGAVKGSSMGGNVVYKNVQILQRTGSSRSVNRSESVGEEVHISTMGGEIRVEEAPLGANVSTMGGNIEIQNAAKYVKAKTMGGDIRIHRVDGSVSAETMGGDVTVRLAGTGEDRDVWLSSKGGEITLYVPDNLSMEFDITLAYTRNSRKSYQIESDFGMEITGTSDWDYSDGTPRKYYYGKGTFLGGKNRIKVDTINGNVIIKRAN
jgi:hypothetical protein